MESIYSSTYYNSVTQCLALTLRVGMDSGIKVLGWEF